MASPRHPLAHKRVADTCRLLHMLATVSRRAEDCLTKSLMMTMMMRGVHAGMLAGILGGMLAGLLAGIPTGFACKNYCRDFCRGSHMVSSKCYCMVFLQDYCRVSYMNSCMDSCRASCPEVESYTLSGGRAWVTRCIVQLDDVSVDDDDDGDVVVVDEAGTASTRTRGYDHNVVVRLVVWSSYSYPRGYK